MSDVREASLEPSTDRLPGILPQAGPFAMLAAAGAWLATHFAGLPARVPVHWNFRGVADRYVDRAPFTVAFPLLMGAAVCALLVTFQLGMRYASPRHAVRAAAVRVLLLAEYLAALACCIGVVGPVAGGALLFPLIALVFAGAVAVAVVAIASLRHAPRGGERSPQSWHGPFYANRDDPALFVPKRFGYGYTVNMGHRLAPLFVLMVMVIPVLAVLFAFTSR
jgi:uncharacterized membrane protein